MPDPVSRTQRFGSRKEFGMRAITRTGLVFGIFIAMKLCCSAQTGIITTIAGNGTVGFSGDGGQATAAQLTNPTSVAVDSAGNVYIADAGTHCIRKVSAAGVISTVAGNGTPGYSGDGGPAIVAQLNFPTGVAVDSSGNLYVVDTANERIRKVTPEGVISTVAGNGTRGFSGDGGPATAAQLDTLDGVAVDSAGNLYIADSFNFRIRKVTAAGVINTVAGNGIPGFSGDGGPATAAQLGNPTGVAVDSAGNLYFSDVHFHRVRKVTPDGIISTVAGTGTGGFSGDGGSATAAQLNGPIGVAVDSGANIYIADQSNFRIRKVTSAGVISTVAGDGTSGLNLDTGPATAAQLSLPTGVAVDTAGDLYIADSNNFTVRKVSFAIASEVFFPQVAAGGGYSTSFALTNTGATVSAANLTLTDQQGNPLTVSGELTDSSGTTQNAANGSAFAFTVPPGGTVFLLVSGPTPSSPIKTGWARLTSSGGSLNAVARYEFAVGPVLTTAVEVPQSQPLPFATVQVDNDGALSKDTAWAVANPGSQSITVKLALVGQDGSVLDDSAAIILGPGQQIARYLSQDLSRVSFKGSLVFRGQAGAMFIAIALSQKQGVLTEIPIIPRKYPGVPN
jgi:sugar lactone lactonase YvrE